MSDNLESESAAKGKFRPFAELIVSLKFLTRLPIPFARTIDAPPLAQAMRMFGVAGAFIGCFNAAVLVGLRYLHFPDLTAATLTCVAGLMITGALHEDGLADTVDGLFGGQTAERRLEIMKDSRIGTYGACALILAMLLRIEAYLVFLKLSPLPIFLLLAAAGAFSRAMVVDLMWATRPAKSTGLSVLAGRPTRGSTLFAIIPSAILVLYAGLFLRNDSGLFALAAALALTAIMRQTAMRLIGGQTGDICGATQVLAELAALTAFAATIS